MDVGERLAAAANEPSVEARTEIYQDALRNTLTANDGSDSVVAILDHATHDRANSSGVGLVAARRVIAQFVEMSSKAHNTRHGCMSDAHAYRTTLVRVLDVVGAVPGLDDEVALLRVCLANVLEELGDTRGGADVLIALVGNASRRQDSDEYWLRIHMQLTRLLVAAQDMAAADIYLKRALVLIHGVSNRELLSEFRNLQARVYDLQHRYYDAAIIFHAQSADAQDAEALGAAVNCAILAPVSIQRTHILDQLVRDERTAALPQAPVLWAAARGKILRPDDKALLDANLLPHHRHVISGTDMFRSSEFLRPVDVAIAEHNVLAAAKVYATVTMSRLAGLTGFSPADVEAQVGRMIARGALAPGTLIDQSASTVSFGEMELPDTGDGEVQSANDAPYDPDAVLYASWCARIESSTQALERVHERLHTSGWLRVAPEAHA